MRPRLETRYGTVEGVEERGVRVFCGIPYARPPVGRGRWRAPAPPEPWPGVRPAVEFGPAAPQNGSVLLRFQGLSRLPQDEDCLHLNVWTPGLDALRRPILVWIHGGGFRAGTGAEPVYDGASLARTTDSVVVSLNYRLGVLGFLALAACFPQAGFAANPGLLDQIAALRWVREHADRLGGDPERVTLFGQSAGAMSVATLLAAPTARGLFHRAILQSGAAQNVTPPEVAERIVETFLKELGLSRERVSALEEVPVEDLLAAQLRTAARSARHAALPFQPYADGETVPGLPLDALAAGAARGIPVVVGTNRDEWNLFGVADSVARAMDEARLLRRLARIAPGRDPKALLDELRSLYAETEGRVLEPRELWFAIESDRHFHLPAARLADVQRRQEPRTYRYLFTWASPAVGGALGSCHGLELPFVFGTYDRPMLQRFVGRGDAMADLSRRIQGAWGRFAAGGSPADPEAGEAWPAHEPEHPRVEVLDVEGGTRPCPVDARVRFWERVLTSA